MNKNKEVLESRSKTFSKSLEKNVEEIKSALHKCCDLECRTLKISADEKLNAYMFFVNGMVAPAFVSENIIKPLVKFDVKKGMGISLHKQIFYQLLTVGNVSIETDIDQFLLKLLSGSVGIIIDNEYMAFAIEAVGWQERGVEEPASETVVKGMRAGFVENIRTNTSLIRRIIKNASLKFEKISIGRVTNTEINIAYIEGIVQEGMVEEARRRISQIDIDGIITGGQIQELIDENIFSPFSQSYTTERVDRACSCLLEGRVVILIDNSPFVIVVPITIMQYVQSIADYNVRYISASFTRILRFFSINATLLLPGLYVAIFSYHHEMIPSQILKTISHAREQLPFPVFTEMLLLEFAFEILREAGVRLPRPVGQAVSIVGALVIGQAAVSARLVSPPSIIVVALTGICSFTVPLTEAANTYIILRFLVLSAAGVFGMPGLICALLLIIVHLAGLRSFGVPYLSTISPFSGSDWQDFLIRVPTCFMKTRPTQTAKANRVRQQSPKQREEK